MVRKIWALLLSAVLLLSVLPMTSMAATAKDVEALKTAAKESYVKTQESTGMQSLAGYCGKMTSHQLWHMGINKSLITAHGNMQFDTYKDMTKTSGGYYVSAYSAEEYTLEQALNAISKNGSVDVYNLLVGFQWTDTEEGNKYGHACVINGILGGKVYFVESFYTQLGGPEGNVVVCTIEQFANIFADWTVFEGVIHFGTGGYADTCNEFGTDIFVRARFDLQLRSQPCVVGTEGCKLVRSVSAGERLRVNGVLRDSHGQLFYRVVEGEQTSYIVAQAAVLERTNTETLYADELQIPATIAPGQEDAAISGKIQAQYGMVGAVEVVITDAKGAVVQRQRKITDSYVVRLSQLEALDLKKLPKGGYTVSVYADTAAAYVREGELDYSYGTQLVAQQELWVGQPGVMSRQSTAPKQDKLDGWYWRDGNWYCYANGKPRTGWIYEMGVEYYLHEDGSVATGWQEIDGQQRYFSPSGAMCVGWLNTDKGLRYSFSDGCFAEGWQVIGVSRYFFKDGIAQVRGTRTEGEVTYKFQADGKAVPMIQN